MTLPVRFPICPLCHGVHKGIPECAGRPQTDAEWMIDRGVAPERVEVILAARARTVAGGHVYPPMATPPEPRALPGPPYGAPARQPREAPAPEPVQEVLF